MKLHEMSVTGQWDKMPDAISLDVVREFTTHGTFDTMADTVATRLNYASRVSIPESAGSDEQIGALVEGIKAI